jgi:tetraacyldisaccharide 4'-kinase
LRRYSADIPVVCVGNITVGGTGKTPVVEFLAEQLSERYRIAVLSRGYGRRTRGYLEVETNSSFFDVGDEPKQIKRKFPRIVVVVCENREEGIRRIRAEHPDVNLILMDDGFQHRSVEPKVNIVLMDYTRPIHKDHMLPWGRLRDLPSQIRRANIVIVTKTPEDIKPIERRLVVKNLKLLPYQSLFFTSMRHDAPAAVFPEVALWRQPGRNVAVMSGIGNPAPFIASMKEKYNVAAIYTFKDHYVYKVRDMREIERRLASLPADTAVITTEKDGVKLTSRRQVPAEIQRRLYVMPMRLVFPEGDQDKFMKTLYKDVKGN